jgi:hypothetical protein
MFVRVGSWRVSREYVDGDSLLVLQQEASDARSPMRRVPIDDEHDWLAGVPEQGTQELDEPAARSAVR